MAIIGVGSVSNMLKVLLLLQIISLCNALLMWPQNVQYSPKKQILNSNSIEQTDQQSELSDLSSKLSRPERYALDRTPVSYGNGRSWFSFIGPNDSSNRQASTPSPLESFELTTAVPKSRKYNPLCFFSALPCSSRRKDVYYQPRRERDLFRKFQQLQESD